MILSTSWAGVEVADDIVAETQLKCEGVVACTASQRIVCGAPRDDIRQAITDANEVASADERKILNVGAQRIAVQCGVDLIHASVDLLDDRVAGIVNDVGIVSE